MNYSILEWTLIIFGGFIAGSINALAGSGSIITLFILEMLGLSPTIANATNRVNIFMNCIGTGVGFVKGGKLDIAKRHPSIIIIVIIGAILGIIAAAFVSNEDFKFIYQIFVVILFILILINPKKWLISEGQDILLPLWKQLLVFIPLGFYGGFIQMGVGVFFLASTVLINKMNLTNANVLKVITILLYTIIALVIFQFKGMIEWFPGIMLGISAMAGGYVTATFASKSKNADKWAYYLLIVVVIVAILKTFGVFDLILN